MELMNRTHLSSLTMYKSAMSIVKKYRPRRDSNPQSSDSKSDALSIRPQGRP